MKELEPDHAPYWRFDLPLGEVPLASGATAVRLRLHAAEEPYFDRNRELIALTHPRGRRVYFHARPYIRVPNISVTVRLFPAPSPEGAIGEVVGSHVRGTRPQDIGNAQAWFYPAEQTFILWECYLYEWCRADDPSQDQALKAVWNGFEGRLLERLPESRRIVTPAWEPIYEAERWQGFLGTQGYRPLNERAFVKELGA